MQSLEIPTLTSFGNFIKKYPDTVTEGGVRHEIFNKESNGLADSGAIVKHGKKILINEPKYFGWLMEGS